MKSILSSLLCFFFCSSFLQGEEPNHLFEGKHFIASYTGCRSEALEDLEGLENAFKNAVENSGATIISSVKKVFPPNGFTMMFLLSESHASIHTYPEYQACFVDLFTCGSHCDSSGFEKALKLYLEPEQENSCLLLRNADISHVNHSNKAH